MSKTTKFILYLLIPLLIFFALNINKTNHKNLILNKNGIPTKNLLILLTKLNIKHDGTLQDIVHKTQQQLLRKQGQERWELQDKYIAQKKELVPLLTKLGMITTIKNSKNNYKHALLLGATVVPVKSRIGYLIKKWKKGLRFKNLIFLGGQRQLQQFEKDQLKNWFKIKNIPKTETDAMKLIFSQTKLPSNMEKTNIIFIDTPMKKLKKNKLIRPTTGDTIKEWLKSNPTPGPCIAVSSQPYVNYQNSTLETLLQSNFEIETIGAGIKNKQNINISKILDSLTRFLYQENKRLKGNKNAFLSK